MWLKCLNVCCCLTVKNFLLLTVYSLVLNVMLVARKLFLHEDQLLIISYRGVVENWDAQ